MIEVKKVEYDKWEHSGNNDPVCPYCGKRNDTADLNDNDGEITEIECDHCGKTFCYIANVSVNYDTIPYENYYLDKRERKEKALKHHQSKIEKTEWEEKWINMLTQEIEDLDKEAERILQVNQRGDVK